MVFSFSCYLACFFVQRSGETRNLGQRIYNIFILKTPRVCVCQYLSICVGQFPKATKTIAKAKQKSNHLVDKLICFAALEIMTAAKTKNVTEIHHKKNMYIQSPNKVGDIYGETYICIGEGTSSCLAQNEAFKNKDTGGFKLITCTC